MTSSSPAIEHVVIYADGCCLGNPGPGGYGTVLKWGEHRKELSGGFARTTNNRMELLGAVVGLEALQGQRNVKLHSDSQYLVKAMEEGWVHKWKRLGWMRNAKEAAVNPDIWQRLLDACKGHEVKFIWVRGHSGNVENERCDVLAKAAAKLPDLPPDAGFRG